jgi:Phosphodiester glycosidase
VAVLAQATDPGRTLLSLCIQEEAIGATGIIRDDGPPYVIGKGRGGPRRVEAAGRQRAGFLAAAGGRDSHLKRFERERPDRRAIAIAGCGNLQVNPGVEARTRGIRAGIGGFMRAGIRVEEDGRGTLLEGSRLEAALSAEEGATAASPDRFVITGPLLVAAGKACEPDVREYADLRHLLLPGYVEIGRGRRVDFGFDALVRDSELARAAVEGRPVTLPLATWVPRGAAVSADLEEVPVRPESLRAALRAKGYRESARPGKRGTFRLDGGSVTIAFLEGIYPHHALAIAAGGGVTSLLVTGRSNREGTTVRDLAAALARGGARAAILLDNGGDVGLLRRAGARMAFAARPAEADRATRWPLRACLVYHEARPR